jgi:hypothetical protein
MQKYFFRITKLQSDPNSYKRQKLIYVRRKNQADYCYCRISCLPNVDFGNKNMSDPQVLSCP